jgi:hypothetical protein
MPLCLLECWTAADSNEEDAEGNDEVKCDAASEELTEEVQSATAQNSPAPTTQTEASTAAAAPEVLCEVPAEKPEQKQVYTPERLRAMLSFDDEDSDAFWEQIAETETQPQTNSKAVKTAAKETLARRALSSAAAAAHKQQQVQRQQQQQRQQPQQQPQQQQQPVKRSVMEKFNAVLTQGPGLRVLKHHQSGRGAPQLRIIRYDADTRCIVWLSNKGALHKRVSKSASSSSSSSSSSDSKLASVPLSSVISVQRKHAVVTLWLKDSNGRGVGFEPQLEKDAIVLEEALLQLVGAARSSCNSPPPATR